MGFILATYKTEKLVKGDHGHVIEMTIGLRNGNKDVGPVYLNYLFSLTFDA